MVDHALNTKGEGKKREGAQQERRELKQPQQQKQQLVGKTGIRYTAGQIYREDGEGENKGGANPLPGKARKNPAAAALYAPDLVFC
jgi:hypothetical protein